LAGPVRRSLFRARLRTRSFTQPGG